MLSDASQRRFTTHAKPGKPMVLGFGHPAVTEGRSLFTKSANAGRGKGRALISALNQRKIGRRITMGAWAGFEVYTLTLEERKTCPRSCTEWRSCVTPETRVLKASMDWVPIGSLSAGDRILGFDEFPVGKSRRSRIATVEAVGRELMPCYRVTTSRGVVTATGDHRWVARSGRDGYRWHETGELSPGDELAFFVEPWVMDKSYTAGRVRGFMEGEGSLSCRPLRAKFMRSDLSWSQKKGPLIQQISNDVHRLGFSCVLRDAKSGVKGADMRHGVLNGGWREIMRFMGRVRPTRLMDKIETAMQGQTFDGKGSSPAVVLSVEFVGMREVVTIATSTKTLITEGFLSHNCYGNHMPWSLRLQAGPELEAQLEHELKGLQAKHPKGFVVRLHILGDFYSVEYVQRWIYWLDRFPALHVFGYTARAYNDPIGIAVRDLARVRWDRFAIRSSGRALGPHPASVVVESEDEAKREEAILCPAQTDKTSCCATCALCWSTLKAIAFLRH